MAKHCSCVPSSVVIPPEIQSCKNCLQIASAVISCVDSVGPCGAIGVVDLAAMNDITACNNGSPCSVTYSILSFDALAFSAVAVVAATGVLTFTTAATAVPNSFGEIRYQVVCDCLPMLSGQGDLRVCIKDLCFGIVCDAGDVCDPCDGTCGPEDIDIELG